MANEIQVRSSLQIRNGNLKYQSQPTAFNATMTGVKGPTPGAILISSGGTQISLAQLATLGGMCRVMNLDGTRTIEVGIYVVSLSRFIPFMSLLPGETYVFRMSEHLGEEYTDTGTGSTAGIDYFWAKVSGPHGTPSAMLLVEAFDL